MCGWCYLNKLKLTSSDLALKLVHVEGYMIPYTLAPVLETLLIKYGDISAKSEYLTQEFKSFLYFFLCQVLKRMCNTMVVDLTMNLLQEWYYHLTFVKSRSFEIDFAFSHLDKLICAFLSLQSKRLHEEEIPNVLDKKMTEVWKKMIEMMTQLEKSLEICKEYRGSSPKSEFMEQCLNEASEMKWKKACEGLF